MEFTQELFVSNSGTQKDLAFFYLPVLNSGTKMYLTLIDGILLLTYITQRNLNLLNSDGPGIAFLSLPHKTTYNLVSSGTP